MKQLLVAVCVVFVVASTSAFGVYPTSMAVCGDSVSQAACSDNVLHDAPTHSWATGIASDACSSHIERIIAAGTSCVGFNSSVSGADTGTLVAQATNAIPYGPQYVCILMGHNDVCITSANEGFTDTAVYTQRYNDAIDALQAGLPGVKIMVSSLIKVTRIWDVANTNFTCKLLWALNSGCNNILKGTSTTRTAALNKTIEYNNAMSSLCATQGVYYDPDVYNIAFARTNLSTADCFHPNIGFQNLIANATYDATRFN